MWLLHEDKIWGRGEGRGGNAWIEMYLEMWHCLQQCSDLVHRSAHMGTQSDTLMDLYTWLKK